MYIKGGGIYLFLFTLVLEIEPRASSGEKIVPAFEKRRQEDGGQFGVLEGDFV